MIKFRVLITSVSGAFGPKNIDFMKESIKGEVWVLGVDKIHSYVAEKNADKFVIVPSGNSISYIDKICELIKIYNISLVLPCSDEEAISLSKNRIKNLVNNAKFMLDGLPQHEDEWLGFRPTLPDYLPIIGPSKNYKNVFYSFGHHHLGWTLGAISGKIISTMIANENTNLNLEPYSSKRFQ